MYFSIMCRQDQSKIEHIKSCIYDLINLKIVFNSVTIVASTIP